MPLGFFLRSELTKPLPKLILETVQLTQRTALPIKSHALGRKQCTWMNPILSSTKPAATPQTDRIAYAITAEKNFQSMSTSAKAPFSSLSKTARFAETHN